MYVEGYGPCAAAHLGTRDGTLVSRVTHGGEAPLRLTRAVPADAFGVAVALGALDAEIRHGGVLVRSGRIPPGGVTFQRPGQSVTTATRGRWDVLLVHLPRATVLGICAAAGLRVDPDGIAFLDPPAAEPEILRFARRAAREIAGTDAFARLRVELIARDLAIHMLRRHSTLAGAHRPTGPARGGLAPRQLRRALDAMDGMLEGGATLAALAAAAGCSPAHFSRAFRRSTGMPPFAWLLARRVERAQALLRAGEMPVAEVALAVGFAAQAQFTTAFKRATGATPAAWRRAQR